jgi:hypothetical protein
MFLGGQTKLCGMRLAPCSFAGSLRRYGLCSTDVATVDAPKISHCAELAQPSMIFLITIRLIF